MNISVEILEKLEMYKELSKFSFYPLTDEQKLDISNIMKELIKEINEIKKYIVDSSMILKDTDGKLYPIQKTAEGAVAYVRHLPSKGYKTFAAVSTDAGQTTPLSL